MSHLIKLTQFSGLASLFLLEKGRLFGLISDVTDRENYLCVRVMLKLWCDVNHSMHTMAADMWDMSYVMFSLISYFS